MPFYYSAFQLFSIRYHIYVNSKILHFLNSYRKTYHIKLYDNVLKHPVCLFLMGISAV